MNKVISLQKISKKYPLCNSNIQYLMSLLFKRRIKSKLALQNINMEIKEGERIGLIGSNGAGKSTLLQIISRLIKPTEGTLKIDKDLKISSIIELGTGFDSDLTVSDNLNLYILTLGIKKKNVKDFAERILSFAELNSFKNYKLKNLSSGMKSRVFFSSAILLEADVYIIDEVLSTGDLYFMEKCMEKFKDLEQRGKTFVIASHENSMIRKFCTKVFWMENGKLVKTGKTEKVLSEYIDYIYAKKNKKLGLKTKSSKIRVRLFDKNKNEKYVFMQGESINLELQVDLKIKEKCFCSVSIFDNFGKQITGWDFSEKNSFFKPHNNVKKVSISFKNYLGKGKYFFKIGIVKDSCYQVKNDIIFFEDRVGTFYSKRKNTKNLSYLMEIDADIKILYG